MQHSWGVNIQSGRDKSSSQPPKLVIVLSVCFLCPGPNQKVCSWAVLRGPETWPQQLSERAGAGRERALGTEQKLPDKKWIVKNLHVKNAAIFSPHDSTKSVTVSRSRYGNDVVT
jgi:hypothetical protein